MKKIRKVSLICFYNDKNQVLLQERGDYSKRGEEWGFFGGGFEEGENALQAFYREAKEELDLNMDEFDYKYIGEHIFELSDRFAYRNIYLIKTDLKETDFTVYEGSGAKYFHFDEILKLKFPSPVDGMVEILKKHILD